MTYESNQKVARGYLAVLTFGLRSLTWVVRVILFTTPHLKLYKRKWIIYFFTNLQNIGLISTDRGTKATLMLTIPSSIFKSFTKDL